MERGGDETVEEETKVTKGMLAILGTVEPDVIKAVTENGWEEIEMAVDTAATEAVVGEEMLESVETKEGAAKRRGIQRIRNIDTKLGGKDIHGAQ